MDPFLDLKTWVGLEIRFNPTGCRFIKECEPMYAISKKKEHLEESCVRDTAALLLRFHVPFTDSLGPNSHRAKDMEPTEALRGKRSEQAKLWSKFPPENKAPAIYLLG